MKKYAINHLSIEVTRKCNMQPLCLHCMRGNPQNQTIKKEYIDSLLNQTLEIGELAITGGEPTLCIDEIDYIIDKLIENAIPLFTLNIVTNGLIFDERFIEVIKKYSKLISICRSEGFKNDIFPPFMNVIIGISVDKYHSHQSLVKENIKKYKKALYRIAQVSTVINGDYTRAIGNAEKNNLFAFKPWNRTPERDNESELAIIDNTHKTACKLYPNYQFEYPEQVLICCGIELLSNGNLIKSAIGGWSYDIIDKPEYQICHVHDDIYSSILDYNKGKISCSQHSQLQKRRELHDIATHSKDINIALQLEKRQENNKTNDTYSFKN